jgi:short-subunit dehydrogenase
MKHETPTVLILGGTSAVAMAYARNAAKAEENIVLVGRNKSKLEANVVDLKARGAKCVQSYVCDLGDSTKVDAHWSALLALVGHVDRVLIAYGVLGKQSESQDSVNILRLRLETNFVSAALWSELAFKYFRQYGSGQITVIGSVAGDRGRQSNYHYGASKGALTIFMDGMAHRAAKLNEAKLKVLLIKPGFIDTPMTDHIEKGGPLWASPEKIAVIIRKSELRSKRVVYAPWFWRFILMIIRYIPFFVFKRSSL